MNNVDSIWDGCITDLLVQNYQDIPEVMWAGEVIRVQRENFTIFNLPTTREVVAHPGAVGVIPLDEENRIALIRQYRHPVRSFLFEPVAGLLDKPGETPLAAAKRELVEEAGLRAETWSHVIDLIVSPGGSTEIIRFFLAENLSDSGPNGHWSMESEEKELPLVWVNKSEFRQLVMAGKIQHSVGISAVLTAFEVIENSSRKSADSPWPLFDTLRQTHGLSTYGVSPKEHA